MRGAILDDKWERIVLGVQRARVSAADERVDLDVMIDAQTTGQRRLEQASLPGLEQYRGKPTLAIIFVTWCSSCNDSVPYLTKLYADYHPRSLEIYSVVYDLSDDGGWFGPATGKDGRKRQQWFEGAVDALVAHAKG